MDKLTYAQIKRIYWFVLVEKDKIEIKDNCVYLTSIFKHRYWLKKDGWVDVA